MRGIATGLCAAFWYAKREVDSFAYLVTNVTVIGSLSSLYTICGCDNRLTDILKQCLLLVDGFPL
jgi:hypothetical protein